MGSVRFAAFEFDLEAGQLYLQGRRIPLQDQPARLLALLISRPGALVSREDARNAIWSELTFVDFDTSLNVAVNKLRRALHDSATAPRFVETVAKRGYRFIADVHVIDRAPVAPEPAVPAVVVAGHAGRRLWPLAVGATLVAVTLGALWLAQEETVPAVKTAARSVAVLPFKPLVVHEANEALQTGIAADVIGRLGRVDGVVVTPFDSVRRFGAPDTDPLAAGRSLNVEAVLDGHIQRDGAKLKVNAQLRRVYDGVTLWAESWETTWTQIFTVQDSIAARIVDRLEGTIAEEDRAAAPGGSRTASPEAYRLALEGQYHFRRRTARDSGLAVTLFKEALRLDPKYADAWAGLAMAYTSLATLGASDARETMPLAKEAASTALELDPASAVAYSALGLVRDLFEYDSAGGETAYKEAVRLAPTDAWVLGRAALPLANYGRFDEALELNRRELALDPTSVVANRNKAIILYIARRYDECIEQCKRTLELDPYFETTYGWLAGSYEQKGEYDRAFDAAVKPLTWNESDRPLVDAYRKAYRSAGWQGYWRARLDRLLALRENGTYVLPYQIAGCYVRLGDGESAIAWLQRSYDERSSWTPLISHPEWDALRTDARFRRLMARVNLTP